MYELPVMDVRGKFMTTDNKQVINLVYVCNVSLQTGPTIVTVYFPFVNV